MVAAPAPIDIVELGAIRTLLDNDQVVIACGGGGIPVIEQKHVLKGASAVIEKDAIAAKLAIDVEADELIILTGVDSVMLGFGTDKATPISSMTTDEAKKYIEQKEFEEGTMLPKIEAAIRFLDKNPKGRVLITSIGATADALKGRTGTLIKKNS